MSEEWDFYLCRVDDEVASISVDLGAKAGAPDESRPTLVWVRVHVCQPRENGFPTKPELAALAAIEDRIVEDLKSSENVVYIGRCTCDGARDFYFYGSDGVSCEARLTRSMAAFPDYRHEVGHRDDPDWSVYQDFLYPPERDMQTIQNRRVRDLMDRQGDQPEIERPIDHWIYFDNVNDPSKFERVVVDRGFTVRRRDAQGDRFLLVVTRSECATLDQIDATTLDLYDLAREYNGEYDGFESPVTKESDGTVT